MWASLGKLRRPLLRFGAVVCLGAFPGCNGLSGSGIVWMRSEFKMPAGVWQYEATGDCSEGVDAISVCFDPDASDAIGCGDDGTFSVVSQCSDGTFTVAIPPGLNGTYTVTTKSYNTSGLEIETRRETAVIDSRYLARRFVTGQTRESWNHYVDKDNPALPCVPASATSPGDCRHVAETPILILAGESECGDYKVVEDGVDETKNDFEWLCSSEPERIQFESRGMAPGRRLLNLINAGDRTWRFKQAHIVGNGRIHREAAPSRWWDNPFAGVVGDHRNHFLSSAGTIYLVAELTNATLSIVAEQVTVVGVGTGKMLVNDVTPTPTPIPSPIPSPAPFAQATVAATSGNSYVWIEGLNIDSSKITGNTAGIMLDEPHFTVLREITIHNAVGGSYTGVKLHKGAANRLERVDVTGATSGEAGLYLEGSVGNFVRAVTVSNNAGDGVRIAHAFGQDSFANHFFQLISANNGGKGIAVVGDEHRIVSSAFLSNGASGVVLGSGAKRLVANVTTAYNTGDGLTTSSGASADDMLMSLATMNNGAYGTYLDVVPGQRLRVASYNNFSGDYENNGKGGSPTVTLDPQFVNLVTGLDFRLRSTSPLLDTKTCATAVAEWSSPVAPRFLTVAVELAGNGNGYCEENERCLFAPNIGAYQGEGGVLGSTECPTPNELSGVTLLRLRTNGVP